MLSSTTVGRCYNLIFEFLFSALRTSDFESLLKRAGADPDGDWQMDVWSFMRENIQAGVQSGDDNAYLDWVLKTLDEIFSLLLPGGDIFGVAPSPDSFREHCSQINPNEIAKEFLARLLYHLVYYHFSHVSNRMPELPAGRMGSDLSTACEQLAEGAYNRKPDNVSVDAWFGDIQANAKEYVTLLLRDQASVKPEKEAA